MINQQLTIMQQLSDHVKFNNRKPYKGKKPNQGVFGPNRVGCWVQELRTAPKYIRTPYTTKSGQVKNRLTLNPDSHPIRLENGAIKTVVHFIN